MSNQKRFFYILSYARCRSTWFSQFLSTNVSYCYHEALSGNDDSAFDKMMNTDKIPYLNTIPYIGSADTNALSFCRVKRKNGPMVLIYRDPKDVVNSMLKAFEPHPGFNDDEWEQYIKNIVEMQGIVLDWYKENEPNKLVMDFEGLNDVQNLMRVFKHCVPAFDPDWSYIENMNNLKITVKNPKGMENGIEFSMKMRSKDIEEFKKDHLERYDRQEFFDKFNKPVKPEPQEQEYKHIITPDQFKIEGVH